MGKVWPKEDAARRLLFLFIGKKPGDTVHISDLAREFDGAGASFDDILSALTYAQGCKWIRFDGELVELLPAGFEQPLEFPKDARPIMRS